MTIARSSSVTVRKISLLALGGIALSPIALSLTSLTAFAADTPLVPSLSSSIEKTTTGLQSVVTSNVTTNTLSFSVPEGYTVDPASIFYDGAYDQTANTITWTADNKLNVEDAINRLVYVPVAGANPAPIVTGIPIAIVSVLPTVPPVPTSTASTPPPSISSTVTVQPSVPSSSPTAPALPVPSSSAPTPSTAPSSTISSATPTAEVLTPETVSASALAPVPAPSVSAETVTVSTPAPVATNTGVVAPQSSQVVVSKSCSDFSSKAAAQAAYMAGAANLDKDGDSDACEDYKYPDNQMVAMTSSPTSPAVSNKAAKCDDFNTKAEAEAAYRNGASNLDADNDGEACESTNYAAKSTTKELAYTGANTTPLMAGGIGLVILGSGALMFGNKKKPAYKH